MKTIYLYLTLIAGTITSTAQTFTLKSADLQDPITNQHVYNDSGCTGENLSPQLSWDNAPKGTKSFAIVMYDSDASKEGGWAHWILFDIPATTKELKTGAGTPTATIAPQEAIQGKNDFGTYGYGGPCPPKGKEAHRYEIAVYALRADKLGLDKNANPSLLWAHIERNSLGKAKILSHYGR